VGGEGDRFRLGAAQIDADLHQTDRRSAASRLCSKAKRFAMTRVTSADRLTGARYA
jgi:hypothetical protein